MNYVLTIPFDGLGGLEVDLLCCDARVAIEIDGIQHLSSKEAYRTDRRKDLFINYPSIKNYTQYATYFIILLGAVTSRGFIALVFICASRTLMFS